MYQSIFNAIKNYSELKTFELDRYIAINSNYPNVMILLWINIEMISIISLVKNNDYSCDTLSK